MMLALRTTSLLVFFPMLAGIGDATEVGTAAVGGSPSLVSVECGNGIRCYNGGSCVRAEEVSEWRCDCSTSTSQATGAYCENDGTIILKTIDDERRMFVKPPSLGGPTPPAAGTPAPSPRATAEDTVFVPPSPLASDAPAPPSAPVAVIPLPPSTAPVSVAAPTGAPVADVATPSVLPTIERAPASPTGIVPLESDAPSDVPSMTPTGVAPTVDTPTSVLIPTTGPPITPDGGGSGSGGGGSPAPTTNRSTSGSTMSQHATSLLLTTLVIGATIAFLR